MAVECLINGLELDCFDDKWDNTVHETLSDTKALVLKNCYGRGKPKSEISLPRMPIGIPTRIVLIPDVDVRQMLPTRKRAGRGRARILSHNDSDAVRPAKPCKVEPPAVRPVPQKKSLFNLPETDPVCFASNPAGATDIDSFEYFVSDEEDENVPLLPSQRGVRDHPFGVPPKLKKLFNVKSANEFPTLGKTNSNASKTDQNNSATLPQKFPSLPSRTSSKVTNVDIVFKPMKEKKKKKHKGTFKKTDSQTKSNSVSEEKDCVSLDGDSCSVQCMESVDVDAADDGVPSVVGTELPPLSERVKSDIEIWTLSGDNVVQVDGLPNTEDISDFKSMLSNYGTVLAVENKPVSDRNCSIRVKYSEEDSCEFAVSCLHGADCVFPDFQLQCYIVTTEKDKK